MENSSKKELLLMLDIETLGTKPGCVILSVAFKSFALNSSESPVYDIEYGQHINVLSSLLAGLKIDSKTIEWWQGQDKEAQERIIESASEGAEDFHNAMIYIYNTLTELNNAFNLYIFGRGVSTFDLPILEYAMKTAIESTGEKFVRPWGYYTPTDVRSIYRFAKWCGMNVPAIPTPHDAMDDVQKQIIEMQQAYNYANS